MSSQSAALLIVLVGCGGGEEADQGPITAPVEAAVVQAMEVPRTLRSVGVLEAGGRVQVRAELEGRIDRVAVREGDRVARGAVLMVLEADKMRAEVDAARAAVARARTEAENLRRQYERNEGLLEQGAISPQTFDDIRAAYEAARAGAEEEAARLALVERRLEDAVIRAPFEGQVGERAVDPGEWVSVGAPVFELVATDPLEIEFTVPERSIGELRLDAPVSLSVASFPGREFHGRVAFISPVVDADTRTVKLKAEVANPTGTLLAGQFADVQLLLERVPGALMLPEAALVPGRDETIVFRVRGGTAERVVVRTGIRSGGRVQLVSGVAAGDTVVVAGQQRLEEGARVSLNAVAEPFTPETAPGG